MQTQLADFIRDTPEGLEAEAILRKCVHCGFCTATCPTYQLLGDELDGPRGRIYLMKQRAGGRADHRAHAAAPGPLPHLPRLRDWRARPACSTAGSSISAASWSSRRTKRGLWDRLRRPMLAFALPRTALFGAVLKVGQALARSVCRGGCAPKMPPRAAPPGAWPAPRHARKMLALGRLRAARARAFDQRGRRAQCSTGSGFR